MELTNSTSQGTLSEASNMTVTTQPGTNQSETRATPQANQSVMALQVAFGVIAGCALVFNLIFCGVLLRNTRLLRKPHNILLFSLAIADLLTGVVLIVTPGYVAAGTWFPDSTGLGQQVFCALLGNRYFLFALGKFSIFLATCLAIERWCCVLRPIKYKQYFHRKRVVIYILLLWIIYCALQVHKFLECGFTKVFDGEEKSQAFIALYSFSVFLIPCLVTWSTFAQIKFKFYSAQNGEQTGSKQEDGALGSKLSERAKSRQQRLLRMCSVTAIAMTLCWFPAQLSYTLSPFGITDIRSSLHKACNVIAFFNSCINPFIYRYYRTTYRKEFSKIICPCKAVCRPHVSRKRS